MCHRILSDLFSEAGIASTNWPHFRNYISNFGWMSRHRAAWSQRWCRFHAFVVHHVMLYFELLVYTHAIINFRSIFREHLWSVKLSGEIMRISIRVTIIMKWPVIGTRSDNFSHIYMLCMCAFALAIGVWHPLCRHAWQAGSRVWWLKNVRQVALNQDSAGEKDWKGCTIQGRTNVWMKRKEVLDGHTSTIICLGRWTYR